MNILITGGTGFIGKALTTCLLGQGHEVTVLSRNPGSVAQICGPSVKALASLAEIRPTDRINVVINLAGAPIVDARWTAARKQLLRESRIDLTRQLISAIAQLSEKPELLISGSAIGYYGDQGDTVLTEQAEPGADFAAQLCNDWELAARQVEQFGVRLCLIRTGLVLAEGGGFLQRLLLPFRLGLGGRVGNGQQWLSWIHRQDWINLALAMIADPVMYGAYNAVAPNPVTNAEFTHILAHGLNRPALLPVPAWLLKIVLGELSQLILGSQRVMPERLLDHGFEFQYPQLAGAINEVLAH